MKHTDLKRAVKNTASVLAALLLMGMLTGCFGLIGPKPELKTEKVTITIKGDDGLTVNEPKTLEVAKGTKWSEVKLKVKVSYKTNYKAAGFRLDSESGSYLYDNYSFYANKTVFAISKKIPQPNDPDLFKTDGNGVITGYTCDEEDLPKALIIPAKIGNEVITGIGSKAFSGCTGLTSIDLSGCTSLTKIEESAFEGCTGLTSIDLSGCTSLTEIGREAFYYCTGLTSIDLSACTSLTEIGYEAFKGCSKLTGTIVFPASLKTIKSYSGYYSDFVGAFEGCTKLQGADFSACTNFTKIENSTFKGCTGLTEVKLPASLTEIGCEAFKGCSNLTGTIVFPASLKTIKSSSNGYLFEGAFEGCTKLQGADFSACTNFTKIENRTFKGCTGLNEVKLPASLTTIGYKAFYDCTKLASIDLSGCTSLNKIENSTFKGCTGLTEVKLPENLNEIGKYAFNGCAGLTSAVFADKNDWKLYNNYDSSYIFSTISSTDLATPETAAKYLCEETDKGGYCDKWWKKN